MNYPDIRIAEYSGIDPLNPVDKTVSGAGTGTTSNSGSVTTTNPNDLLVGANYVTTHSTGPGTSFTQRVITNPDGSILEDRIVTTTGSYNATAPSPTAAGSCKWSPSGQRHNEANCTSIIVLCWHAWRCRRSASPTTRLCPPSTA